MECDKRDRDAVMHVAYSGARLCDDHFYASAEKRVRRRIREDNMLPRDASPEDPQMWVIGLSGGKDSVIFTYILDDTSGCDPRIELVALTIREGIEGYRDKSVDTYVELVEDLDIHHEPVTHEDEFGVQMDDVVEKDSENMTACAYCGVPRRDLLERFVDELGADKLLTGHNLDDEAQTALMNFFEGDLKWVAKYFDANIGDFEKRRDAGEFIPWAKLLRDAPEKEVALYVHLKDLPAYITECLHSLEAYCGEIQQLLLKLEENHPGTRHSTMVGYEKLVKLTACEYRGEGRADLSDCERCGSKTAGDVCRRRRLIKPIEAIWAATERYEIRSLTRLAG